MEPAAPYSTFWRWNSPLPYLFGGLGLMLTLISIALVILVCSYRRRSSSMAAQSQDDFEEKSVKPRSPDADILVPQIVVIMAGEENPSRLAVPVITSLPKEWAEHHHPGPGEEKV